MALPFFVLSYYHHHPFFFSRSRRRELCDHQFHPHRIKANLPPPPPTPPSSLSCPYIVGGEVYRTRMITRFSFFPPLQRMRERRPHHSISTHILVYINLLRCVHCVVVAVVSSPPSPLTDNVHDNCVLCVLTYEMPIYVIKRPRGTTTTTTRKANPERKSIWIFFFILFSFCCRVYLIITSYKRERG